MRVCKSFVGARGVDSLPFSQSGTVSQALALRAAGIDFVVGYLGVITFERVQAILDAGLAFMPVTLASGYDGNAAVVRCEQLGIPDGCTVWLDLEGQAAFNTPAPELSAKVVGWHQPMARSGFNTGLYVGSPQPLTSEELYALPVSRYWNALSRETDRRGALAEPKCGWCMWQMNPSIVWKNTGVFVDVNIIGEDFQGRVPNWVVQA